MKKDRIKTRRGRDCESEEKRYEREIERESVQ